MTKDQFSKFYSFGKTCSLLSVIALPLSGLSAQCAELLWSDEFEGTQLDTTNWSYMHGDGSQYGIAGWGNNELQSYQAANAEVSDGLLRITAREEVTDNKPYSSARLRTVDKQDFTYGFYEARIKLPAGKGLWPAFWMLPTDYVYGGWPQSGEIDIMEWVGRKPEEVLGTVHFGQPAPGNRNQGPRIQAFDGSFADEEHTFGVDWKQDTIRWFLDGYYYGMQTKADLAPERWPFDQDFHFLLNMAVGGNLGGDVEPGIFPATMEVDYVRVYDGPRPYLTGNRNLRAGEGTELYEVSAADGMDVTWTVPTGATIVSGQGTKSATVDWGASPGGVLAAEVATPCGPEVLAVEVQVRGALSPDLVLENFDDESLLTLEFQNGAFSEVANPAPDDVNGVSTVGKYVRNDGSLYDIIVYRTEAITDGDKFSVGASEFLLDVWTDAAVGTQVLVQLETDRATSDNFPDERHSRYFASTTQTGGWETLRFKFRDRPKEGVPGDNITKAIVFFAPETETGDTYYFDNFEVVSEAVVPTADKQLPRPFGLRLVGNTVQDVLTLDYAFVESEQATYRLINFAGQVTRTGILGTGTQRTDFDVSALPAGYYAVQVVQRGRAESIRFFKL